MANINSLAEELIESIISKCDDNLPTLHNLFFVSKKFCRIAEKYFYRNIYITSNIVPFKGQGNNATKLLHTVKKWKHLGPLVHSLGIKSMFTNYNEAKEYFISIQGSPRLERGQSYNKGFEDHSKDLDNLCGLFPNLETFNLGQHIWGPLSVGMPKLKRMCGGWYNLKTIDINIDYDLSYHDHVFKLPAIETIALRCMGYEGNERRDGGYDSDNGFSEGPPPRYTHEWSNLKSNVKHVLLELGRLGKHDTLAIAKACPHLRSLTLVENDTIMAFDTVLVYSFSSSRVQRAFKKLVHFQTLKVIAPSLHFTFRIDSAAETFGEWPIGISVLAYGRFIINASRESPSKNVKVAIGRMIQVIDDTAPEETLITYGGLHVVEEVLHIFRGQCSVEGDIQIDNDYIKMPLMEVWTDGVGRVCAEEKVPWNVTWY